MLPSLESHRPASQHDHSRSVFADDPVRGLPLSVNKQQVAALKETGYAGYLSTQLIDYLLQQALKDNIPSDLLIGTACLHILQRHEPEKSTKPN